MIFVPHLVNFGSLILYQSANLSENDKKWRVKTSCDEKIDDFKKRFCLSWKFPEAFVLATHL